MYKVILQTLGNGKTLVCGVIEILSLPEISVDKAEQWAEESRENVRAFLDETYNSAASNAAVLELLWVSVPVQNQPNAGQVHLYIALRAIGNSAAQAEEVLQAMLSGVERHLQADGVQYQEFDPAKLQASGILPDHTYTCALLKSDQSVVHTEGQQSVCCYYAAPFDTQGICDFTMLSRMMADRPGCAVSFQLIPTVYTMQESMALPTWVGMLSQFAGESVQPTAGMRRDPMVQPALEASRYYGEHQNQALFRYNILTFGAQSQCTALASQLLALLQKGKTKLTPVNLTGENVSMSKQFAYYPWNLNKRLVTAYRDLRPWNSGIYPAALFRLAGLATAEEAATYFHLPAATGQLVGIATHHTVQNIGQLDARVTAADNIQFGVLPDTASGSVAVGCSPQTLTKHMLIVGKPGTGKTTFSVNLLLQLYKKGIPFLAIEPTKTEYRAMIDAVPELQIFTPGNSSVSPFVINPFIPPKGITVEQYIPSLAGAFKAVFNMESPLDVLFQAAIQETYAQYGWRNYSTAESPSVTPFGLHEFILVFRQIIERQDYKAEVKGNLQSAGVLRLRNLIEQNPNIYDTTKTVPLEDLLARPTVLELNAIDNQEQKSVLMALLLTNICVYTKHRQKGDGKLKNAILIDESHVLFGGTQAEQGKANAQTAQSLENMVAEIRSYGTSVIIADQSPAGVGAGIVKNTEVKVAFQLVEKGDREMIAAATSMSAEQAVQLGQLNVGEAFVSYIALKTPIIVKTPDIRKDEGIRLSVSDAEVHDRMHYWDNHAEYLIPFNECETSNACKSCSARIRSDAAFYSLRFFQICGAKIVDSATLRAYLKAVDGWLEKQLSNSDLEASERAALCACTRIQVMRRCLQQKSIPINPDGMKKWLLQVNSTQEDTNG